jgi:hypothetical protein
MWRERTLKIALIVIGLFFVALVIPVISILWNRDQAGYTDAMMLSIYFVLGIYLLRAAQNPAANRNLIGFTAWANVAHAASMTIMDVRGSSERHGLGVAIFGAAGVILLLLGWRPSVPAVRELP